MRFHVVLGFKFGTHSNLPRNHQLQTSSKVFWLGLPLTTWGHGTTHGTCPLLGPQNAGCPACWPRRQGPCSRCDGWHESRTVPQSDQQLCRKLRDEGMAGMTEESLKNILGWFIQWFPCKSEICSPLTNQGFIHPSLRLLENSIQPVAFDSPLVRLYGCPASSGSRRSFLSVSCGCAGTFILCRSIPNQGWWCGLRTSWVSPQGDWPMISPRKSWPELSSLNSSWRLTETSCNRLGCVKCMRLYQFQMKTIDGASKILPRVRIKDPATSAHGCWVMCQNLDAVNLFCTNIFWHLWHFQKNQRERERESQSCKPWTWWPMANHDHPNSMILHDHHDHGLFMLYPLAPRSIGVPFHRSAMAFVFLSPWQPWGPMAAPAWPSSPSRPRPAVFATPPAALGLGLGLCLAGAGAMRKRGTQMRAEPKQKSRFRPFFRFFKGGNER